MAILSLALHALPVLGIIGYFCEIEWMVWAGGIMAIILNFFMEAFSKKPKILSLYAVATIVIGIIHSHSTYLSLWFSIVAVASFTYITWWIFGLIFTAAASLWFKNTIK